MKCAKIGCEKDGYLQPTISFASKVNPTGLRCEATFPFLVCQEHGVNDVSMFVNDEGWAQIVAAIKKAGRAYPDRASLQVRFVPFS